jgi:uncharacterized protein
MKDWELKFENKIRETDMGSDPAHDLAHFRRVVATATQLAKNEGANLDVVVPAAWLHDLVNVPKNDPRRSIASRLSAEEAVLYLRAVGYDRAPLEEIAHAVEAHSFSANITPRTLEAKVVQDADRLDGLGAIGVARVFAVAGLLGRQFYDPADPFALDRALDDQKNTVDHFYVKLFKTADTLQTVAGRDEGRKRVDYMRRFLDQLRGEISG